MTMKALLSVNCDGALVALVVWGCILKDSVSGICQVVGTNLKESKIHFVHSASLAHEDGVAFRSGPFAARP